MTSLWIPRDVTQSYIISVSQRQIIHKCPGDTDKNSVHQSLAPYLVTIDSQDPPDSFYNVWTPWITQSPLLATVPLLSASCYLSNESGVEVAKSPETIRLQSRIISVINEYLRRKKMKDVDIDAVAAVFYLALNEVRNSAAPVPRFGNRN
jgi:hypothetical protein